MPGSHLFQRNRAVGYVSNNVPAVVRYFKKRKDNLIVTCIGRAFQVYSASHFRLLQVSGVHPDEITCLASDQFFIYTASDKCIYAWKAGKQIKHIYKGHNKNVHLLLPFRNHLIAVDEENVLKLWEIKKEKVYLEIPFNEKEFRITALMHPPTYINKILLGSEQGSLQLWNVKDHKLIYTFSGRKSRVTALQEASTAIDVAAVGYHDGGILLLNLKFNEIIMELKQDWGMVTGISFRTDVNSIMLTSGTNGNVVFWDLDEKKLVSQIQAHDASVTTTCCFPGEPLFLTTSPDNSMKLWIFEQNGGARLLRIREGHHAPPLCIRYHGNHGKHILSSGEDSSLRVFSTVSETLNKSMGRASYNREASKKKSRKVEDPLLMPPIVHFTNETTREKEWDDIVAIHSGLVQATTWSFNKNKMGNLKLVPEQFFNKNRKDFNSEATCIILTHCGNFVIIGYSSGDVERFNVQSGAHRGKYGLPAHTAAVRGVACDNLNQFVVSGGSDNYVKFWNFNKNITKPTTTMTMPDGVAMFRSHREGAMLCVALENFVIYILDCDTKSIVRKFEGHTGQITDATFSPDSRWLLTAAMDSTIKIWDIPSAYLIDHFKVEIPCISLSMSPTGDFLATAHVNCLGIYLWANKTLFSQISLRSIDPYSEAPYIDLPSSSKDNADSIETQMEDVVIDDGEDLNVHYESPEQLSSDLITLSTLPPSRWQNLLDLDLIKKRNKPKIAPKAPKQAPFFLPTVDGLEMKFDLSNAITEEENSKLLMPDKFINLTKFGKVLSEVTDNEDYEKCINYLKALGPSMLDFEIKSLHPIGGGNYNIMLVFLKMIVYIFKTNINFELGQAYLATFLKSHGRNLSENKEIFDYLKVVEEAQNKGWKLLEEKLFYTIGVVSTLRNNVTLE